MKKNQNSKSLPNNVTLSILFWIDRKMRRKFSIKSEAQILCKSQKEKFTGRVKPNPRVKETRVQYTHEECDIRYKDSNTIHEVI